MELKNALSICLIALFSATLVVLIARSLDSAAAARLEPQLAKIAEELAALRASGGIVAAPGSNANGTAPRDGLIVYFFHGNTRCPTCRAIESQTHAVILTDFADPLESGEIVWKTLNYEDSATAELTTKFEIQMSVIVLARMKNGQIDDWKRLDQVWGIVGDKPEFAKFMQAEVRTMLDATKQASPGEESTDPSNADSNDDLPSIPLPDGEIGDLPLPTGPAEVPE